MVRVPLPFRGVAVLLLAATTVVGQTPEPPTEFLSLDGIAPTTPPNFLREFSADTRHPLLSLMVDGEVAMVDAAPAQDSAKPKLTPKTPATPDKKEPAASAPADGCQGGGLLDGCQDGALLGGCRDGGLLGGCAGESLCPTMPNVLPYACAPPLCCCTKCKHRCGHKNCGGCGCGNPYLSWPGCCDGCGCRHCRHKHSCGCATYGGTCGGCGGDGWNTWGGDGYWGGDCGCGGCFVHCEPLRCCCTKCHKHRKGCCGCGGYGYACGGGCAMGYDGGWDGGCGGCCMPPPCCSHKCRHKHGCNSCCGYGGSGWGCGMASVYAACNVPCCEPCYKHHCFGRHHRCHGCQQPYCPMMAPCMGCDGLGMGGGGFGMGYDGSASDGSFGDGFAFDATLSGAGY